jgi:CheY-like chemotaxis protein
MSVRTIRLLHVEDDAIQRRMLQAHLARVGDLQFDIVAAETEDDAIARLGAGFDLVVLDYHLAQGNGLACLKRIRSADSHLPIIAISGVATPEIAAELLEAGADDYFAKDGFDPEVFGRSVRTALARADAWKVRAPDHDRSLMHGVYGEFETLASDFAAFAGANVLDRLDNIERACRSANLTFAQILRIFDSVCERLAAGGDVGRYKKLLRPIMLDLVLRLFEEGPLGKS